MPELYPEHDYQDSPDRDAMYDDAPACKVCGEPKIWVECWHCGGDGYCDETDIDPLEGDEFAPCSECAAKGGWYECGLAEQHFTERNAAQHYMQATSGPQDGPENSGEQRATSA